MGMILVAWTVCLFLGPPIWLTMALAGTAFIFLQHVDPIIIAQQEVSAANSFTFVAAPLFILMGHVMNNAGVTNRIFDFATAMVGWLRGGLCHANVVASMIFAGMSGSAVAEAGGLGTVEIRAMRDAKYPLDMAAGLTAAAATIGPIIPPSLPMVVYGAAAEVSVGKLFMAGVIPGVLMGLALMVLCSFMARRLGLPKGNFPTLAEIGRKFRAAFWALMTPVVLLAGMLSGVFTPTEAAAVATLYALILGLFVYRSFSLARLPRLILDTAETTGVVMALVMAAKLLGWALAISRIPQIALHRSARLPPDRECAVARCRLLHGRDRGDADPDSDPRTGGDEAGDRSRAFRAGVRSESHDRHGDAAGGGRAVCGVEHRPHLVRAHGARDRAVSDPAPRRAGCEHALATAHHVAAAADDRAVRASEGQ
jgi:tripartite ATP-independent transporter DctM subunit